MLPHLLLTVLAFSGVFGIAEEAIRNTKAHRFPLRRAIDAHSKKISVHAHSKKKDAKTTARHTTTRKSTHTTSTSTKPRTTSTKHVGKYSTFYTSKATTTTTKKTTATSSTHTTKTSSALTSTSTSSDSTQLYYLTQTNRGADFYSSGNWDFFSYADPTHGNVTFLSEDDAVAQGLAGIDEQGRAYAAASTANLGLGEFRPSVRFQSQRSWNSGLVVFDVAKMPVGCATWPALWTVNGATWPENGEIDVMEGIGYTSVGTNANLVSVHLNDSVTILTSSALYAGSTIVDTDCMTNYGLGNTGCSFRDSNSRGPSWGPSFNANGGGVWAMEFGNSNGIKVWFWPRSSVTLPMELNNRYTATPILTPVRWGKPMASFQNAIINQKVNGQQIVLDITIAGDWAGNEPMDGNCGTSYVQAIANGSNYVNANFLLNGIDVYCLGGASNC